MASTPVQFIGPGTGLTITGKLYVLGGNIELHSSLAIERSINKNRYVLTVTEALSGFHEFSGLIGSIIVVTGIVYLEDTIVTRHVQDDLAQALALIDNKTVQEATRCIAATTAGKLSGAGTGTEVFKGLDESTTRVTAVIDAFGNRTDLTYN